MPNLRFPLIEFFAVHFPESAFSILQQELISGTLDWVPYSIIRLILVASILANNVFV